MHRSYIPKIVKNIHEISSLETHGRLIILEIRKTGEIRDSDENEDH